MAQGPSSSIVLYPAKLPATCKLADPSDVLIPSLTAFVLKVLWSHRQAAFKATKPMNTVSSIDVAVVGSGLIEVLPIPIVYLLIKLISCIAYLAATTTICSILSSEYTGAAS